MSEAQQEAVAAEATTEEGAAPAEAEAAAVETPVAAEEAASPAAE